MVATVDERSLFISAVQIDDPNKRSAYLAQACGDDLALRRRVEALLDAHVEARGFLAEPAQPPAFAATIERPVAERPGTVIGPYKLLEQIGEGGFGLVFMAEQTRPVRRKVALKVLKPGMDTRQVIARFEAERQALALMDHPNISKVLDAGATESGRPYFVMELVKGIPITEYCDANRLSPRERLEVFVSVCRAVQHAHQKGIIHRDIKPNNVLVASHDGTPVVKVIDFGVAKAVGQQLTDKTLFTGFAQMIGTPLYMSPEQAELSGLDIDTRSDVYSLGVLLYELLTGTTPFDKDRLRSVAFDEIRRIIREDEPPKPSTRLSELGRSGMPSRTSDAKSAGGRSADQAGSSLASVAALRKMEPRKLSQFVRGDLDWIVMKALEKDRNRRYETASGFGRDLQRYLADEPVSACPPSAGYRLRKFIRRNKLAAATGLTIAAALLIALVALGVSNALVRQESAAKELALQEKSRALTAKNSALQQKNQALAEQDIQFRRAEKEREKAEENALQARKHFYAAQIKLAQQAWDKGQVTRVLELLEAQRPRFDEDDLRTFEWYYLWRQCTYRKQFSITHIAVADIAFSPDGKLLASGDLRGNVILWDVASRRERARLRDSGVTWLWRVVFSPDGRLVAAGDNSSNIVVWDVATGQTRLRLKAGSGAVRSLAISPDGKILAAGATNSTGGVVKLWDLPSGLERATLQEQGDGLMSVAFSPDSRLLASAFRDWTTGGRAELWDLSGESPRSLRAWEATGPVVFLPDGGSLVDANGNHARRWDVTTGELLGSTNAMASIKSLAVSPDSKLVAICAEDRTVRLWDARSEQNSPIASAHSTHSVAFTPDAKSVVACGWSAITFWGLAETPTDAVLPGHFPWHSSTLALSPDGKTLAIPATGGKIKLCDPATGTERATLNVEKGYVTGMAFSGDGRRLAAADPELGLRVWDTSSGQSLGTFTTGLTGYQSLALSPDGKTAGLGGGGFNGEFVLWDVDTQTRRAVLQHKERVCRAAFSPDGVFLVTAEKSGEIHIWHGDTLSKQSAFFLPRMGHSWLFALALSPDGKTLVAAHGNSGGIHSVDVDTGRLLAEFNGHTSTVCGLAISPDGTTLISAGEDGTVRLWDLSTGQERLSLIGHQGQAVISVAVTPDGNTIATGGADGTVRLWHAGHIQEARAQKSELNVTEPGSPANLVETARGLLDGNGAIDTAKEFYRQAADRLAKLARTRPLEPDEIEILAGIHHDLALLVKESGDNAKAELLFRESISIRQKLAADFPQRDLNREYLAICQTQFAYMLASNGRLDDAEKIFAEIERTAMNAVSLNNLAWWLVTSPSGRHYPEWAIELSQQATKLSPADGSYWNTLGVAQYRAGNWEAAIAALKTSMELQDGGVGEDWFFMAMAEWQGGNIDQAQHWYDKAAAWTHKHGGANEDRFRTEADELLATPDAEARFTAKIERDPANARNWLYRARFRACGAASEVEWEAAGQDALKAVELAPDDLQLLADIAASCLHHGKPDAAISVYSKAMELRPDNLQLGIRRDQARAKVVSVWNFDGGAEGWQAASDATLQAADGVLRVQSTGPDPWITAPVSAPAGPKALTLWVRTDQECTAQLFWEIEGASGFAEDRSVRFDLRSGEPEWTVATVRFSSTARLTKLRLDPPNDSAGLKCELEAIMLRNVDDPLP